ncbi:response regulator [Paenibacillus sp. 1P07SE]|uniref:response regulator transcription factor n=1 Tax=Paenibacillus sp. 1P07SE TaxID=3132209 RepID=UPI0039A70A5B
MYRVLIVDDEPWAIKGIRNAFNWSKYGFEIAGEFTSPRKAFEAICAQPPDLVFTDIQMGEMSGLELMRLIREQDLDVGFVVVSGYSEFAYAQEALRFGALDYCLKPIDIETTDGLIEKLLQQLSQQQSKRNQLMLEALTSADNTEVQRFTPFFEESEKVWYRVVMLDGESTVESRSVFAGFDSSKRMVVASGKRKTLHILKSGDRAELGQLDNAAFDGEALRAAGISSITDDREMVAKLIKEADLAVSQLFIQEGQGLFTYEPRLEMVKPFIEEIPSLIEEKTPEDIKAFIHRIQSYFRQQDLGMGEAVFLWNQTVGVLMGTYAEALKDMELEFLNYVELQERFEHFESLCGFIHDVLVYLKQISRPLDNDGTIHSCFLQMVQYIDRNYEQRLYLKELAAQFHINQVYCCQLFKKLLGKTFSEYVTDLRIRKACELLEQSPWSIEEVAAKVGYVDYYYFNKVFKKQCRITPAKYRKRSLEGAACVSAD